MKKILEDKVFAEKFRSNCFIEGSTIQDYSAKLLEHKNCQIIASPRFINRNIEYPYINIDFYSSSTEEFFDKFDAFRNIIFEQFKVFNPKKIRISLRTEDLSIFQKYNPSPDLENYSIRLENIYKKPINSDIRVEKINQLSDEEYDKYVKEYKQFNFENPHLIGVTAESLEDINRYCQSDFGFKAYVDNQWAGLGLYCKDSKYFYYGYLCWDKIIFKEFRGQNLSAALQNKGFQEYIPSKNGFLYGTIHSENHGSRKTAIRSGRENLVTSYFFA